MNVIWKRGWMRDGNIYMWLGEQGWIWGGGGGGGGGFVVDGRVIERMRTWTLRI